MNCPKCFEPLRIAERQGIEIDYCPDCRGVWLDRGELDKIIQRTIEGDRAYYDEDRGYDSRRSSRDYPQKSHKYAGRDSDAYYKHKKDYKKYKKKHIIKEIFDIFD